jgi:hypothetical protein
MPRVSIKEHLGHTTEPISEPLMLIEKRTKTTPGNKNLGDLIDPLDPFDPLIL